MYTQPRPTQGIISTSTEQSLKRGGAGHSPIPNPDQALICSSFGTYTGRLSSRTGPMRPPYLSHLCRPPSRLDLAPGPDHWPRQEGKRQTKATNTAAGAREAKISASRTLALLLGSATIHTPALSGILVQTESPMCSGTNTYIARRQTISVPVR